MKLPSIPGYEVVEPLGEGGMGQVFRARDQRLDRWVALKLLAPRLTRDESARERLTREARLAASVEHPNVCSIFEIGSDGDDRPFIAMSYCPGPTMADRLAHGPISPDDTREIVDQTARALGAAHKRGIVHRDVKPSNISFSDDGVLKVLDFGIASLRNIGETTTEHEIAGTTAYMSPEQVRGQTVDARTDVWALGVILYECLTGVHPFRAPYAQATAYNVLHSDPRPLRDLSPELEPGWQYLVSKCLARDLEERFESMDAFCEALAEISESTAGGGYEAGPPLEFRGNVPGEPRTFVGRERLHEELLEALTNRGSGVSAVLVSGESGIGKSQLVSKTLNSVAAQGARLLLGRCVFNEGVLPYHPFVTALKQSFGVSNLNLESSLPQLASQLGGDLAGRVGYLRAFLTASDDSAGVLNREQLWDSVLTLYRALASEQHPLIIFVDDLQWADESTLGFFSYLARSTKSDPIRLVAAYRLDAAPSRGAASPAELVDSLRQLRIEGIVKEITVDHLDERESTDLIAALFNEQPLDEAVVSAILEKTGGHPLFISEMVKLIRDHRIVVRRGGVWMLASREIRFDVLPQRVQDVIHQRLSTLEASDRELLEVASIEGERFTSDTVAYCLGWTRIQLLKRLQILESRYRLIVHLDQGYRFDHSLMRQTLYDGVLPELRSEYHRMIAETLEERFGADLDYASSIATHLLASDQPKKAVPYLVSSGARARAVYALNQALNTYEDLDGILRESPDPDPDLRLQVDLALGDILYATGSVEEASNHLISALETARRTGNSEGEFEATRKLALCRRLQGSLDEAMTLAEAALELTASLNTPASEIKARHTLTDVHSSRGDYAKAVDEATAALELSELSNDFSGKSVAQSNLGFSHWHMGAIRESMAYFLAAQATQRKVGDRPGLAMTLNFLALAVWKLGRFEEAIASASESVDIKRQINLQRAIPGSLNIIGDVYRDLFDVDRALDFHRRSFSLAEKHGNKGAMCDNLRDLGADFLVAGNVDEAEKYFGKALDLATDSGLRWYQTRSHLGLAEAALYRNDPAAAADHAREGSALAESIGARELLIEANWALARSGAAGTENNLQLLESAFTDSSALGLNTLTWQIELDLADFLADRGDDEEAQKHRAQAVKTLQEIVDRISDAATREHFLAAPKVAQTLA